MTLDRLGLLNCPPGVPCGLPRARQHGGKCGAPLDPQMRHIWHCRTGVARLRIHNAVVHALARELRRAGGNVDLERAMPSMTRTAAHGELEEGIMDITCWFPGSLDWYGLDVTVRYAGATRYVGAARRPGLAASRGEKEKKARYGNDVLPIAFEAGGRMGEESERALQQLADAADACCGDFSTRRGLATRWRRRMEAALLFAAADSVLCALGKSSAGAALTQRWCTRPPLSSEILALACGEGQFVQHPGVAGQDPNVAGQDPNVAGQHPSVAGQDPSVQQDTQHCKPDAGDDEAFMLEEGLEACLAEDEAAGHLLHGGSP